MDNIIKFLISIILVLLIFYFHKKYENFSVGKCYGIDGEEKIINDDGTCSNYCYCFNGSAVDPETPDNNVCINETKQYCYSCDEEYELTDNLCYDPEGNFQSLEEGEELSQIQSVVIDESITNPVEELEEIIKDFVYNYSSSTTDIADSVIPNQYICEYTITLDNDVIADILLVGGGGGGGAFGGGGGGGGVLFGSSINLPAGTYTIIVGGGGRGATKYNTGINGSNGYDSSITINGIEYTANGGGGGGTRNSNATGKPGNEGGSGGGGSHANSGGAAVGGTSTQSAYAGWESYGSLGGSGRNGTGGGQPNHSSGGGGGAGYVGENAVQSTQDDRTWSTYGGGGDGGAGIDFSGIFTTDYGDNGWFAGGGGGQTYSGAGREGWGNSYTGTSNNIRGFGGGGDGGFNGSPVKEATKGIDGTGGGGGGARTSVAGADGGSGIVLIKYSTLKSNPFSIIPSSSRIAVKGLKYHYYNQGYAGNNVNWFVDKTPVSTGYVWDGSNIGTLSNNTRKANSRNYYSFIWTGYFKAKTSGTYTFSTSSDDASFLWIGDNASTGYTIENAIVNNKGTHPVQMKQGTINLTENTNYPIRIQFGEKTGGDNMKLRFKITTTTISGTSTTSTTSAWIYDGYDYYFNYI